MVQVRGDKDPVQDVVWDVVWDEVRARVEAEWEVLLQPDQVETVSAQSAGQRLLILPVSPVTRETVPSVARK